MNEVVIRPLRFSGDVQAMRAFLEQLGLRSRIESKSGTWVELVAGHGMVALHDAASSDLGAQPGETTLAFEAADIEELKDRLEAAGYEDASIVDEAFGRVLTASGPDGTKLWIDERSEDLYGYTLHDSDPDPRWSVTPSLGVSDQAGWERLLGTLNAGPVLFRAAAEFDVRIEFTTTENLAEVARRLTAYQPEPGADGLSVVDPDGQTVRVHG